jgi:hypothetical protein
LRAAREYASVRKRPYPPDGSLASAVRVAAGHPCAASRRKVVGVPLTKLVGAGPGSFMVKRSGESFSTPHRAARSRLATADLKRFASVRSPLGNPAGVTFGQRVSAHRCGVPLFEVGGPTAPWAKTAGQSARPQAHAAIENVPGSQPFVFNRILPWAALRGSQDLVVGGKRREGGRVVP